MNRGLQLLAFFVVDAGKGSFGRMGMPRTDLNKHKRIFLAGYDVDFTIRAAPISRYDNIPALFQIIERQLLAFLSELLFFLFQCLCHLSGLTV